jgi:hypothetical protein
MMEKSAGPPGSQNEASSSSIPGIAAITVQLLLLTAVVRELDILVPSCRRLLYFVVGGFLVNHFLPAGWRFRAFLAMSIAGILFVLGDPSVPWRVWDARLAFSNGAVVAGVGLFLIGICLLRIGFWLRVVLLAFVAVAVGIFHASAQGLVVERAGYVLAAIFMTRIALYLYDVSTWRRPTWRESIGYFFLAPNAAFYIFPNLDFKTFCRSHYTADALATYQRGVRWMARGVLQLVIYGWNERNLLIAPASVQNGRDIAQYLASNYLTYLNISGTAHFAVGLLLLFGFNLPETHHRYMLASSFTDFWRRVNIYWKDFMQKVFYMPTFFRLRKFGHERALMLATAWVFIVSWAIHLWGTWWLTLNPGFTLSNTIFWGSIGAFVVLNVTWEYRYGRRRTTRAATRTWPDDLRLVARTAATFLTITVLMTLLNHPDMSAWLRMWTKFDSQTVLWLGTMTCMIGGAKLVMEILPERGVHPTSPAMVHTAMRVAASDGAMCLVTLAVLYAVTALPWNAVTVTAARLP